MNLRYINLWIGPESGYNEDYRYEFKLHTRFISHFLSTQIRKLKFQTDGTFNMISIAPTPKETTNCSIVPLDCLKVEIPFNQEKYEKVKQTYNFSYYFELLEKGFKEAANYKDIPLKELLGIIEEFKKNGAKNEWIFKKKTFKEQGIVISLNCYFTTLDFKLVMSIRSIQSKEVLCTGTIIRTMPDEIYFDGAFKDIIIKKDKIIVTDSSGYDRVIVDLDAALNKRFKFNLAEYPFDDNDKEAMKNHVEVNKMLSYDGEAF